ncbi:Uncharacterised protein [uncultured archaeon]|nr:Uncharacterised protein [uncultured archaeon]
MFIILGIVLVAGLVAFFVIRGTTTSGLSKNLEPAYQAYLSCIQERAKTGLNLMGQQAGYIYLNELPFDAGSTYAPTSSQLDFYGASIPYWLYVSGNNFLKENRPTLNSMETDLARYIREGLADCDFSSFNSQGIYVDIGDGNIDVAIGDKQVKLTLTNPVFISFENESALVSNHEVTINSQMGSFYKTAAEVLDSEMNSSFLESYAIDTLRLNAPVTGVDIGCTPKLFDETQIKNNISSALENNVAYLKLRGNYYTLNNAANKYFVVNLPDAVSNNANFIYSRSWPTKIEMYGNNFVEPVGTQEGMGMLGMCFVPYHFVYDISFPVLVQLYSNNELFQFPMVVIVKNNEARAALNVENETSVESPVCTTRNQDVAVSTYDLNLNPVSASLRFSCVSDSCEVGSTQEKAGESTTTIALPQCVNGVLTAYAPGYAPSSEIISTNTQTSADVIMKKIHSVQVDLPSVTKATVVFSSKDYSSVLNYPDSNSVDLVEGEYNVTAYVYKNSTIVFPAINDKKCFEVASTSFAGLLGDSKEQCFDVNIPSQNVDSALVGGGKGYDYFIDSDLTAGKKLSVDIPVFKTPTSLQELQDNYLTWEDSILDLSWK